MCDVLYNKRRGEEYEKHQNRREYCRISKEKRTDFAGFCQTDQFEYCFAQPVGTEYWQSYQGQTMYDVLACDTCHANLELLLMTLEGKSWTSNGYTQHTQEEEVAYVLQGEVTIDLEGEVFVLGEEDTIRILPGRNHKLYNHTDTEVKVLFVKCRI